MNMEHQVTQDHQQSRAGDAAKVSQLGNRGILRSQASKKGGRRRQRCESADMGGHSVFEVELEFANLETARRKDLLPIDWRAEVAQHLDPSKGELAVRETSRCPSVT
jgi:hypothetical protein